MKLLFNLLTFSFTIWIASQSIFAQSVTQDSKKTFLRWKVKASKDQIKISKNSGVVKIESLDEKFFEKFSESVTKIQRNENYHNKFIFKRPSVPGGAYSLELPVKDQSIELFSFYQDDTKSYILDFWVNKDLVNTKASASKPIKVAKLNTKKVTKKKNKKKASKKLDKVFSVKNVAGKDLISTDFSSGKSNREGYRDFRYGAAFIWDYKALIPPLEKDLNLKIKAPDFLYTVKDRKYLDDKKEAHLQLVINFYRKEQWGLMTKSISLYEKRYGKDKNIALIDFMKATSMIKNTIKEKLKPEFLSQVGPDGEIIPPNEFSKKGVLAAARNVLTNVVNSASEYKLKKSILRYLIQNSRDEGDFIMALNHAKLLYVSASEELDDEMIVYSSRVILNSLANLRQLSKIEQFLSNKSVTRVLPKQEGLAYISYLKLSKNNVDELIDLYKKSKHTLTSPIHPAIILNTAESYFRRADYKNAIKLYDSFINHYSYFSSSDQARLRLALSYDLLDKDIQKVKRLYKDAINKSSAPKIRYEAKLRYVGVKVTRNKNINENDKEIISFLDADQSEKNLIDKDLKKLLWLVRLRTMISLGEFNDALAYLTTIPVDELRGIDQRVFHADGAEIVLGLIQNSYLKQDYGKTVKIWETYKNVYQDKVASNPYMSFIVSDSFLKLGLPKSYKRAMNELETLNPDHIRRFPKWVRVNKEISIDDFKVELKLNEFLAEKNYKALKEFLDKNKTNKNINYNYYNAIASYELKKYNDSMTSVEKILVSKNPKNLLTPTQNNQMLKAYLESLYEVASPDKFRKNTAALVNDLRRSDRKDLKELVSRADYLYLESLFSEKQVNHALLKLKAKEFIADHKDSEYKQRVKLLLGISLVNDNEQEEGKNILMELINDDNSADYLKGLARSELSSLELKSKTL